MTVGVSAAIEIDRVRAALARHEATTSEMDRQAVGDCCAACVFGHRYIAAADQCDRTRSWLIVLLRKRGTAADLAEVRGLEMD